jgi:uncharacterized protein (TIGR00296 family)
LSHEYSDEEGTLLVKLARFTVDNYVKTGVKIDVPQDVSVNLLEMSGVFVTLNSVTADGMVLRGCIGRPYPNQPLIEATVDSAVDAAVNDPRFPPVTGKELEAIVVDLSVLTPPKKIEYSNPEELLSIVKVGRDGLIVSRGQARGLLLPQVPVDWGWDVQEFLEHTCNKAWLPTDAWRDPKTEFMLFRAEVFGEESPGGNVIRDPKHPRC